ncbi:MAG: hypothetical protein IPK13_24020 [Deltaproteobacteria bacterium]|nr:hypothetical protein [Deltaproteobacteria bacterium]
MSDMKSKRIDRVLLLSGLLGVLGNVLGVAFLYNVPTAYRVGSIDAWASGVFAHPSQVNASAVSFTLGLIALAVFGLTLSEHLGTRLARTGGWIFAMGCLANAVGTVTPLVLATHTGVGLEVMPVARALLGVTLTLDALFNLTLGVGLILMGIRWPPGGSVLRWLAIVSGAASLPVAAQAFYDPASDVLRFSGPLWLAFVLISAFRRWPEADAGMYQHRTKEMAR